MKIKSNTFSTSSGDQAQVTTVWYADNGHEITQKTVNGVTGWYDGDTKVADNSNRNGEDQPAVTGDGTAVLDGKNTDTGAPVSTSGVQEYPPGTAPDKNNRTLPPPPPVKVDGVDEKGHFTKASPEALRSFAKSIDAYVQPLKDTSAKLKDIGIRPGHFNASRKYRALIGGVGAEDSADGGLVETYQTNVGKVTAALTAMVTALKTLADKYADADDLSNANANDIQSELSNVVSAFGFTAPKSIPGYTPPDGKEDDKEDDEDEKDKEDDKDEKDEKDGKEGGGSAGGAAGGGGAGGKDSKESKKDHKPTGDKNGGDKNGDHKHESGGGTVSVASHPGPDGKPVLDTVDFASNGQQNGTAIVTTHTGADGKLVVDKVDFRPDANQHGIVTVVTHLGADGKPIVDSVDFHGDRPGTAVVLTHLGADGIPVVDRVDFDPADPADPADPTDPAAERQGSATVFAHLGADGRPVIDGVDFRPVGDQHGSAAVVTSFDAHGVPVIDRVDFTPDATQQGVTAVATHVGPDGTPVVDKVETHPDGRPVLTRVGRDGLPAA